tara:strand:+ start:436 stop:564 length:129 start_codon:yes stop_codon:yes gene_type:complete
VFIEVSPMVKNIVYFSGGLSSKPSEEYIPIVRSPVDVSNSID